MTVSLAELAVRYGCELVGDPDATVSHVAPLESAGPGALTFLANPAYRDCLPKTGATVVVLGADDAADCAVACLLSDDPYASYARMAAELHPPRRFETGVHPRATIEDGASIAPDAWIGANAVVSEAAVVGPGTVVEAGCFVGPDVRIGADCRLHPQAVLVRAVTLGDRCIVHSGAVIGADGFGNARTADGWVKVPQVGGVRIGADVEIGANTTIDCGAVGDTVIGDGVRIDNQCMIAHNVEVGAHTAMAAMTGIAGSTKIGERCLFAGQAGCVGHIRICDDVIVSGQGMVSKDITAPGVYASSFPVEPIREWNRQVARFRRLGDLVSRVRRLERDD